MSEFYNPKRSRNLYRPKDAQPFKLSRSKIELFLDCPRCFYLDRRLGVGRPPIFPYNLNSAVDALLKKEFDRYRAQKTKHPIMEKHKLDAIPAQHNQLNAWRENFKGVQYLHEPTQLLITGAIDDLWINSQGKYSVVDYKSTAKEENITALDKGWHDGYKRQMEVYQWLLMKNGLPVSRTGYFVYANGKTDRDGFNQKLEFDLTLISYDGDPRWVEKTITALHKTLKSEKMPGPSKDCDYCLYAQARAENENEGN